MPKKILIAEDEKPMAKAMQLKLVSEGFEVSIAGNGKQALEKLAKEKFDLLILDLVMPVKDGFVVLEELKKSKRKMPVIVASNLSQEDDVKRAKSLGARDFFVKSDTPISGVVERVKAALGKGHESK